MTESRRILIVRTSAMGDIVHGLPVALALRNTLPNCTIAWVVEHHFAPLLEDFDAVDQVIPVRTKAWRQSLFASSTLTELSAFRSQLRTFRADVALDLMGNHKGAVIARLSGAPKRVGIERAARREPSSARWINHAVPPTGPHAVEHAASVLQAFGPRPETLELGGTRILKQPPDETVAAISRQTQPFVLIHPGAGWKNKEYPAAWWGTVAQQLSRTGSLPVRIVTSRFESKQALDAVAHSEGTLQAVEVTTLASLAAWLRAARLVVGGDTGPLHLAHAMGAEVLMLMGPTDPQRHGPFGAPDRVLCEPLPCSFCYQRLDEPKACLRNLDPERVAQQIETRLAATPR